MQPYQQRVIDEKRELDEKREKLKDFFVTERFHTLDKCEKQRLVMQDSIMDLYSLVLGHRISAFSKADGAE